MKERLSSLPLDGLEQGQFTLIDGKVQEIARDISLAKDNLSLPARICDSIRQFKYREHNPAEFRQRTGSQIWKSGYVTGCTDCALAAIVVARALRQPCFYTETVREGALKKPQPWKDGHIFVDFVVDGGIVPYSPRKSNPLKDYFAAGEKYIVFGRGIDFSSLFFLDHKSGLYFPEPRRLQTNEDAEAIAREYYGWER